MKNIIKFALLVALFISCTKTPPYNGGDFSLSGGVFILNEGNFMSGNGSLSFYSYDSVKIFNDVFSSVNGRPLGDVPNSMIIKDEKAYIVVNNSGKIEVIDNTSLHSLATINGLISPRIMAVVNNTKAYVSSLYSDSLTIIDLTSNTISGYVNLRRTSEAIVVAGNKAYVANWVGGKEIMVLNTLTDKVTDSVEVGIEPESMVLDRNNTLWVLCNGGYLRETFATLVQVNISTDRVQNTFTFPTKEESPANLIINSFGQTLYFLDKGVKEMDINSDHIPGSILIPESGSFYKMAINPVNGDIFVTDALDFSQKGYVSIYKNADGALITKEQAGIIPGAMCFKLRY